MKVLVTGGAGFIGSHFVQHLLATADYSVVTLDALTYAGTTANLRPVLDHSDHEFVEGNVCDTELVDDLAGDVDAIVNFAAESHVDRSIEESTPFVRSNVMGTQTLLDAARKHEVDRFVQISTDEVYGEVLEGKFTESDPLQPRNPYAATKAGADLLARSYHTTYGLPIMIARSSNNYGPRQNKEKLIPKTITRAVHGEEIPVYGDGSNTREWTFVKDNCRAIETVLADGESGSAYNIGSGIEVENLMLVRRILEKLDRSDDLVKFVKDRAGHDQRYALDTSKITALGWEPQVSFETGIERTIKYYINADA